MSEQIQRYGMVPDLHGDWDIMSKDDSGDYYLADDADKAIQQARDKATKDERERCRREMVEPLMQGVAQAKMLLGCDPQLCRDAIFAVREQLEAKLAAVEAQIKENTV